MRPKVALIVAALVVLNSGARDHQGLAQTAQPLRIDAIVTNSQGAAITGLRVADFELREDGVSRPIRTAEFRWVPRHSTVDVFPIETRADEQRAARQPGTRVFAFFLDEFHVSPNNADRVREAVGSFLDDKLYMRDLAVVIRPLDSVRDVRFTRDRAVLRGSLAAFAGRQGDYEPRTPIEEQQFGRDPAGVIAARNRSVKASLTDLGVWLGELNADRAVVVLVSEGFPVDPSPSTGHVSDFDSFMQASSRFHFPVYTFNPRILHDETGRADDDRATATLQWLAQETGGLLIRADAFIAGFARVFHDTHGYYALTYEPAHTDHKFHQVDLRTRVKAHVRSRTRYWAGSATESSTLTSAPAAREPRSRRVLRRSALIDAWIGVRRHNEGDAEIVLTWEPRPVATQAPQKVAIKVRSLSGTVVFDGVAGPVGATSSPEQDRARIRVPPGRVQVDMTVLGADGNVLDTDARDFDVPDLRRSSKSGPVLLPVEIVRTRTRREFERAQINPDATPTPARAFARGDRLLIRVPTYDSSGIQVRVSARILNRNGEAMRDIAPSVDPPAGLMQFMLSLASFAPGPYQIEVTATNGDGAVKERVALIIE